MQKNTKQMGKTKNFDFTLEPGKMKSSRISMNKGTSLITVITICSLNSSYNYVVQMMNSLINQTFPYWEWIIVINDNKSDIINLKNIDKRIKIIVYDYETIAKAKIEAIKNSSTELIFNFEENDLLNATMLECGFFAKKFYTCVPLSWQIICYLLVFFKFQKFLFFYKYSWSNNIFLLFIYNS